MLTKKLLMLATLKSKVLIGSDGNFFDLASGHVTRAVSSRKKICCDLLLGRFPLRAVIHALKAHILRKIIRRNFSRITGVQ